MRSPELAVAAAGFALAAFVALAAVPASAAAAHTITIDGTAYAPAALAVKQGDTVTWVNKDPFPHTVTAADGSFDSKSIDGGKSWRYVARKKGRFDYGCTFHPTMHGTLTVE